MTLLITNESIRVIYENTGVILNGVTEPELYAAHQSFLDGLISQLRGHAP